MKINQKKFKNHIINNIYNLTILFLVIIALMWLINEVKKYKLLVYIPYNSGWVSPFFCILGIVFLIYIFNEILYYRKILKNNTNILENELINNYKNKKNFQEKCGYTPLNILLIIFFILTFVCAFIDMIAFLTMMIVCIIVILLKTALYFYNKKTNSSHLRNYPKTND